MDKPTKEAAWCTRNFHGSFWNSERLDYSELRNILSRDIKGDIFAKGTEKCTIHPSSIYNTLENLDDHGCPKFQDLIDEEMWICSSYPFSKRPQFTAQSARQSCMVTR